MTTYTYSEDETQSPSRRRPDRRQPAREENDGSEEMKNPRQGKRNRRSHSEDNESLPGFIAKPVAFFRNRKTRTFLGIAIILFVCYISISALSFLKNNEADQSKVVTETTEQLAANPDSVENMAGPVGAKLSHHFFVEGLGLGSVVLVVYLVLIALGLLGVRKTNFWSLTFKSLIFAVTVSIVLGLVSINSSSAIPPGGYHGRYINLFLISNIGWIGAVIVSCLLVTLLVTIYIAQLTTFYNSYRRRIRTLRAKRIMEKDRDDYRRKQVAHAMSEGPINDDSDNETGDTPADSNDDNVTVIVGDTISEGTMMGRFNIPLEAEHHTAEENKSHNDTCDVSDTVSGEKSEQPLEDETPFNVNAAEEIEQGTGVTAPEAATIQGLYDPKAELSRFRMPPLSLLHERQQKTNSVDLTEQEENKERITKTLNDYGVEIVKIEATVGPTVTLYEIVPAEGVRIARIKRLEDDIAMSLAALGIRIIAPIPGKGTIGIEVPNKDPQTVSIRSILGSKAFQECKYPLPMALGATISNDVYITDLTKMPHLLVAGATGQGKSVGLNTIIASLLYKRHPSELKFVLVDPKMVEFSLYARLEKHYLAKLPDATEPVVTDPMKVVDTLNSLCVEMDNRYALLKNAEVRSVIEYNQKFMNHRLNPEKGHRYLPYIVMIVDEFADLIMMAGKSVETPIARIAQKARAVGMHMIIATQRPSTNVITGIIKANFPGRIGFRVSQMVDSRTILDSPGANQLIGRGDMLISTGGGTMERVQCAFIDTDEVEAICHHIDDQIGFPTAYILPDPPTEGQEGGGMTSLADRDNLFEEIGRYVVQSSTASTSNIQRKYSIGYNRAGKIMDQLEAAGVVGPSQGGKPRQVLVTPMEFETILETL